MDERALPTVSVLVPTYNHSKFVVESLDSIFAQDYPNLEVIVSDDASSDGAQEILRNYAQSGSAQLQLILAAERGGVSVNCNRAWAKCSGKYVALMSGDDLMVPGKIRKQVELMEADPNCALCYHELDVFNSDDRRTLYYWNQTKDHRPREDDIGALITYGTFVGACSSMVRKAACATIGFDETIPVASDWLFLIEAGAAGGSLRFLPEVLGRHRRHGDNVTKTNLGLDEQFRTLAIVEERHPHLSKHVKKGRGRLYYAQAVESLAAGRKTDARQNLLQSIRHGWYSWKHLVRLMQSFL